MCKCVNVYAFLDEIVGPCIIYSHIIYLKLCSLVKQPSIRPIIFISIVLCAQKLVYNILPLLKGLLLCDLLAVEIRSPWTKQQQQQKRIQQPEEEEKRNIYSYT